jgi:hypothetical protein
MSKKSWMQKIIGSKQGGIRATLFNIWLARKINLS